jgi:hypothetical protein
MNVVAFRLGSTKAPYGQFYGGFTQDGGASAQSALMATDKTHDIVVPIHAYLVEHPTSGPIVIDAGINARQARHHREHIPDCHVG